MNIADVAKKAGVSPSTVSRVLNNTVTVKEETKKRVLKVIEESNYTPNVAARNLSLQSTLNNIGIVIPDIDNPFFSAILKGITREADKYGYNVLLFNTDESPEREHRFLQTVREQNLKGIIMIPLSEKDDISLKYLKDLESIGVPVVLVDRRIGAGVFSGVFTNDEPDAYRAVEILIQAGHKEIATISGSQRSTSGRNRLLGFEHAMKDHNLPIRPEYIEFGNFKYHESYEAARRLLDLPTPPTAIFTASNFATLATLKCIMEKGLVVGQDISILGFDEIESWMRYSPMLCPEIQISLVERPVSLMSQEAMELLQKRMTENSDSQLIQKSVVLGNQIVLRGSEKLRRLK